MEHTTKTGTTIKVTAERGNKPALWNPSGNHYRVTIRVKRKSHTFDYWGSYADMVKGEPADLRSALSCFALDAMAFDGARDIDDFCKEFGYTKPSEAIRAYNGCKAASKAAARIGLSWDDLADLADY